MDAFDLAERLQTLVFVMSDLDLGMNTWMSEPFPYPTGPIDRGKVLTREVVQKMGGQFGRYLDVDGDGIPYRSIPGDGMPSYFARGSGHNAKGQYSERPDDYQNNLDRLARKFETAKKMVPKPAVDEQEGAEIGIVAYGTSHWAVEESRDQLAREQGLKTSYLRLKAYPFTPELAEFISRYDRIYVVEQNRDAQMLALIKMDLSSDLAGRCRSVLHYNGLPIDARSITDDVLVQEGLQVPEGYHAAEFAGGSTGVGGE
jgi:2-oxoglutarate ferredoxin oxidoreductase subunit alpha